MQHLRPCGKKVRGITPPGEIRAVARLRDFFVAGDVTAWLVGGTVRDLLLGLEPQDIDIATQTEPFTAARAFADAVGGSYFVLSEEFPACRAISPDGTTYDFQQCRGGSIESDLRERDFTVDAMALSLAPGGELVDPLGGRADLDAKRLASVDEKVFARDPLRLMRAVRLEKELGMSLAQPAEELVRASAEKVNEPAAERRFRELVRILETPGAATALRRMDGLGLLEPLLPELSELQGMTQNSFHHLDVYDHVLAAADAMGDLLSDPAATFPDDAAPLAARLDCPLAGDATRRQVLSLAVVMHDIGKPDCRYTDEQERVRFIDHDRLSAAMAGRVLERFRAGGRTTGAVTQLVRQHMHLVALVNERDVSERARRRFIRATDPYTPEAILLSVSDRLAVRGPRSTAEEIAFHLDFAREMMGRYFEVARVEPLPVLIDGNGLMAELGIGSGPGLGRILDAIREEQEMGTVTNREEALALARSIVDRQD